MKLVLLFAAALALAASWGRARGRPEDLVRQRAELAEFGPVLLAVTVLGLTGGLQRRSKFADGSGYSSPLLAWIGKRTLLAGAFIPAAWAAGPVDAGPGLLWLSAAALLAGAWMQVGNLPRRL